MNPVTKQLLVTPSPHLKAADTTQRIMFQVLVGLMPALVASVVLFGYRSLILVAVSIASCVLSEYLFNLTTRRKQTIGDLSAVVTGTLLAFNVPSTLPWWMVAVGGFAAIFIAKQLFGGIGQNFANPAIVGRVVMILSFSGPMSSWVLPAMAGGVDGVTTATPLALLKSGETAGLPSVGEMLLGLRGGCLGETCAIALILGGLFLIWRKVITWTIPVFFLGTVAVMAVIVGQSPIYYLLSGGVLLGAFFMATDYSTSPVTEKGKAIFAIGCGIITVMIRAYGSYPEGVSFAILIMNILAPHIDTLTRTKPIGGVRA